MTNCDTEGLIFLIPIFLRIYHECDGGIGKSFPRITDWLHEVCRVMTNGNTEGWILLYHLHTTNDSFSCSSSKQHVHVYINASRSFQIRRDVT